MANTRNSSFEFLRLVLMLMIVVHHCIVHGLNLVSLDGTEDLFIPLSWMLVASVVNCLCICAVNCFVLMSGYFGIKTSRHKILFLLFALAFYTILLTVIPEIIRGHQSRAVSQLYLLSNGLYWFITDYIFLMVIAPIINAGMIQLSDRQRSLSIVGLLLISCYFGFIQEHSANINGYTLLQFIMLYCIGREIRIRDFSPQKKYTILGYILCSLICGLLMWGFWKIGYGKIAWQVTFYNNPLVVMAAIFLLLLFKDIHIESKTINKWARSSMSVYLFTSSYLISNLTYRLVRILASYAANMSFGGGIINGECVSNCTLVDIRKSHI